MKMVFHLSWLKAGHPAARGFKHAAAFELFFEYQKRISHFFPCEVQGSLPQEGRVWLCDRGPGSKVLSSEDLAKHLQEVPKRISIVIGGPDGFSREQMASLKPSLRWSFGPLTLPHELAAIVAAEQIYRAFTILKKMPYHSAH